MRWPIAVLGALYALVIFVIFLTNGGPQGVGAFGVVVVAGITLLSVAPVVSIFTGTRTWTVVATVLVVLLLIYFLIGLLLWFPVAAALIAASIAGPPARRSVAVGDDRLDAVQ